MTAQLSPQWFQDRIGRLTGSRIGAIIGVNPYQKRSDVLRSMVREALGAETEFKGNMFTRHGQEHEADAIAALEQETGVVVMPAPLVVHPQFDWLAASPDGFSSDGGLVEAKCPQSIKTLDEVPHYLAQMQLQMACTGRVFCWFVQWTTEGHSIDRVEFDETFLDTHMKTITGFLAEYESIVDDPEKAAPYMEDAVEIRTDPDFLHAATELGKVSQQIKELQAAEKKHKAMLVRLADGRKCKGGPVTVYPTSRNNVDYKQALADVGVTDLEQYTKESTSWTVRVSA